MAKLQNSGTDSKKDTIYIDVDDEITSIIEKLQQSSTRIVALVLPKRASVLQSIVNMKLLKRSAEQAKKNIVLITTEAGLLPLAGAVGVHVAASLQSKPAIPAAPDDGSREQVIDGETGDEVDEFDPAAAAAEPVGKLAGTGATTAFGGAAATAPIAANEPETIELEDDDPAVLGVGPTASAGAAAVAAKKGTNKKLKIPNFNKFRLLVGVGIGVLVLLIGGFVYANATMAKASIVIKTNSSDIATKTNLTLDPAATKLDLEDEVVPAKIATKQQTGTQQVSTSGQKNNGTKATGEVLLTSKICSNPIPVNPPASVPAGTGVSSGNKTYITQQTTVFPDSGIFKSGCVTYQATSSTDVIAQSAGADYNIAAGTFSVAGRSDVTGTSSDTMSGGTDNIVKIVSQSDIDSAKAKITQADTSAIKQELSKKLQTTGDYGLTASLHIGDPVVTPSAAVGDQADTVSVSSVTTYSMYGFKKADIKQVILAKVSKQIDTSKQQISRDGVDDADYDITSPVATGALQITVSAVSLAGPDIDTDALKQQLAGKKTGEVQSILKATPGVTDVTVTYSPFWVSKVPNKPAKVEISLEKASATTLQDDSSDDSTNP